MTPVTEPSTTFFASHDTNNRGNQRGTSNNQGRGRGRGGSNCGGYNNLTSPNQNTNSINQNQGSSFTRPTCQICNQLDHLSVDCYHCMYYAFEGHHPLQKLMAMVANQFPTNDPVPHK